MVKALSTIHANGKTFNAGDDVTGLNKDQMDDLKAAGVVEKEKSGSNESETESKSATSKKA